ncbi:proliferation marker protein Ki-67 isoform X2 [Suricata suricatta]|uniref:proliferation marker protein Ki-67 isoform X2 n=1 Tax=Suricata suricatta TaxID=37032 RepID=UPI001155702E|nr:proliferation marker protein Ki-67 isoform X2 [Suricata suricatta]
MGPTGRLVTIKRSGVDGPHFPLSLSTCLFGRGIECDIRIQLPVVSKQHCKIEVNGQEAVLFNFSSANPTQVNGSAIEEPVQLQHGDVITIVDRSFRYENESHQDGSKSPGVLGQRRKQESLRRVSRSSLPSDPDGKVQDSIACLKPSEENVSGRPLKKVEATNPVSLNAVHPSDLAGGDHRNAPEPTGRDSQDDPSGTFSSCKGGLKSFPSARGLEKGSNSESPFKKLYDAMKEELDVKSEKGDVLQSGRKSRSRSHRAQEKECSGGLQGGMQVPVSPKSRPRSGRSTQVKADAALEEQGISQPEGRREGEEAVETPKEARGPVSPPEEMIKSKTLAQRSPQTSSQKRPREDVGVTSGRVSVHLEQKEGFGAENKMLTPRKSLTRNPTPAKVETAGDFGDTPEKLFSRKRKSIPTSVDILTPETETQNHTILAPLPVQVERKIPNSSVHQPEKGGAAAGHLRSGSPSRGSVDRSNPISKTEGTPLKRRRVSFGGRLKPELFDENLPPNTPLKRGETPRRSLVSHTPPVLKKIIKECPQPSGREDSSGLRAEGTAPPPLAGSPARPPAGTPPGARDPHRRSAKPSASSGGRTPRPADAPRRGGRRSGGSLSKRSSVDRSQHEILQMIFSKRRSGASEANLIVAKSWADVVKLGAKQTQAKAVKHGPQRPLSRRPRKANTPKPVSSVPSQFSTGHANSPCTIIIGKAHLEKVNVPARPYRMPNFVSHKKMDFSEDLSGLTEMFQTPAAKVKPQTMSLCPSAFSNSEDVFKKEFQVPDSGEKPLLCMSENCGENEFSVIQTAPQEPFDQSLVSPVLRRQSIRANVNIEKTPGSEAEAPKAALSANRLRRSLGLRSTQMLGAGLKDEEAQGDTVENASERRLTKSPRQGQNLEAAVKEQEGCAGTQEQDTESGATSEAVMAMRRSRRYAEQKQEPVTDLTPLKRLQDTEPREDLGSIQGLLRTPIHAQRPKDAENQTTEKRQKSSKSELVGMPTRMSAQLKAAPQKADLEEEPAALRKPTQVPKESPYSHGKPGSGDEDILLCNRTPEQKLSPAENVPGSKRWPRTPKNNMQSLEDLAGLRELFQTPNHTDKPVTGDQTTKVFCKSPLMGPGKTPASRKRQLKTPPQKADLEEEPSALRKPTQTPGGIPHSHREPVSEDEDIRLFKETPKQKLDPAANVTGSKRQPRTPKGKVQSLEDLAGLGEPFQTPTHTDKPMTGDQTTKVLRKSPLTGPGNPPVSQKRWLETPPEKADLEEESSALRKPTRVPGERPHSHTESGGGDKDVKLLNKTLEQKPAENVTGSKRQPGTPKRNVQSLPDMLGLKEVFQTPDPVTGDQTTKVPCKSPLAEPVSTPTNRNRRFKTPQKVDLAEESSALRKSTQTSVESQHSHGELGGGDKDEDIKLFNKTPEQKLDPVVTGSKRKQRTPRKSVQSLEDLARLRELFQTPDHTDKLMTDDKTTKAPCKSPLAKLVNMPTSRRRLSKTPPQKVNLEEESLALTESTLMPAESPHEHREPVGGNEGIRLLKETPKQKLDPAENITGSGRRPRTPKRKVQSLEDLAGLKELFKTPDSVTGDHTTRVSCKSPLAEPVNMTSKKRHLKTPPQKVDLEEKPLALRKPTPTPGESPHSHRQPVGEDEDIKLSKETPKQKLDPAANVTGSKRQPRTPKEKVHSLEDLAGLRELFQSPTHTDTPMTGDQTTKTPCKSPLAKPVNTPASRKRHLETPPQKVDLEEESSTLRKPTQMPGENKHSHREPVGEDEDIEMFKKIPEQKLDPAENVTASKKRLRKVKEKVQYLEDMVGFKELFQTPEQTKKTTAVFKTAILPCKSPRAQIVNPPTHTETWLKVSLGEVAVEKELSAVTKSTLMPAESPHEHREPVGGDESIRLLKETLKQKLKPEGNVSGSKRQPRTPKRKVQSLEDLVGLKELFKTPDSVTGDHTTRVSCKSPLAEPVNMTSKKRHLKTPPQKVDLEEKSLALRKPTQTPGRSPHSHGEPVGKDEDIKLFKETPKQKLDPAANVTGSGRRPRTPREKVHSLEDLAGLRELFQSPDHTDTPMTGDQTTKTPCKSPLANPVNRPASKKRRLHTPPQKMDLEEESSTLRKPTQTLGENTHSQGEPEGEDEDIKLFKETLKQKLNLTENVTGSKRQARTPKKKVQSLEDLVGLRELFQSPDHTDKPMTGDQTTKAPCKSPLTRLGNKPTNRRRCLKTPLQKVDLEEVSSALRKPTQMPEENTHSHREPVDGDEDIRLFKETTEEKLEPVGNVTRSKRRPRTSKKTVQSLEDPVGLKELIPTPNHTDKPMTDVTVTKASCKSALTGPGNKPTNRRRQLRTRPQKVDLEEEPSALGKPTQMPEETTNSLRESGEDKDTKLFNRTAKQKLGPTENVMGMKYRLRAPKEKAQTLEDMASFNKPGPTPDHTKKLGGNAGGIKGAPKQIPEGGKPVETLPRVLRAPRAKPIEDQAGLGDPIKSQRESSISLSPKRKRGNKGGDAGTKRLRSVSPVQATAEKKPPQKRRRGAPSEGCDPPGPQPMKEKLRIVADRMELREDLTTSKRETRRKGQDTGRTTPPQQGMSLRSRRPKKPELEEHRPEPVEAAAEKVETKRNDRKPLTSSQEAKPQSPGDRAKNPASQGRVRASRMCLRSAIPKEMPLPDGAEEKQRQKGVAVHGRSQGEERTQRSDFPSLRSRKIRVPPGGNASESESQQQVTRSAKRCAGNIKKDEDNVSIKKIRTRSRRDNEDI